MNYNWNFENSYLKLPKIFYSNTNPDNFINLKVILKNENLLRCLNIKENKFENLLTKFQIYFLQYLEILTSSYFLK